MEINIGMSECHKNVDNYYGSHITVWIPRCAGREAFDGVEPLHGFNYESWIFTKFFVNMCPIRIRSSTQTSKSGKLLLNLLIRVLNICWILSPENLKYSLIKKDIKSAECFRNSDQKTQIMASPSVLQKVCIQRWPKPFFVECLMS